jgi:hypothetical protein
MEKMEKMEKEIKETPTAILMESQILPLVVTLVLTQLTVIMLENAKQLMLLTSWLMYATL